MVPSFLMRSTIFVSYEYDMTQANNLSRQFQTTAAHKFRPNHPPPATLEPAGIFWLADPENKIIFCAPILKNDTP